MVEFTPTLVWYLVCALDVCVQRRFHSQPFRSEPLPPHPPSFGSPLPVPRRPSSHVLLSRFWQVWIVLPAALKFLVNPFDILITVCFVFGGCSVFGVGMITYRNGYTRRASLLRSFLDQLVNAPIMLLFFSHVLWHLTVVCFRCVCVCVRVCSWCVYVCVLDVPLWLTG